MKLKTLLAAWLLIWAVLMLTACENPMGPTPVPMPVQNPDADPDGIARRYQPLCELFPPGFSACQHTETRRVK